MGKRPAMNGSLRFKSEEPVRQPVPPTSMGCLHAGDMVVCRVRRCESSGKEGEGISEPRIEEMAGILERPSLYQPMWWVRVGDTLRYVWTDEIERKK
jgi:hypothetical protein